MTREQFLNDLKAALAGMQESEIEGVLTYYGEMIDDRMEAGMSEEAAVKAMEPVREIAARVLEEAGVAEEKPCGTEKKDAQEICRPAEAVQELQIQAECKRIRIVTAEEPQVMLRYTIGSGDIFQLHEDGGVLSLEHKLRPASSFFNEKNENGSFTLDGILNSVSKLLTSLGDRIVGAGSIFNSESPENEIEVTLPRTFCGIVRAGSSNARISLEDLTCTQPITLSTSNSRIVLNDVNCAQTLTATTSNSRIVLNDVNIHAARLVTTNGHIELEDVFARDVIEAVTGNSGITVRDTEAEGALHLTTSNARVELDDAAAKEIVIRTSNGSVSGTVKGRAADYTVRSRTSNGSNKLGNRDGGDRTLNVTTSNGSISVEFEQDEE